MFIFPFLSVVRNHWFTLALPLAISMALLFHDIGKIFSHLTIYLTFLVIFLSNLSISFKISSLNKTIFVPHCLSLFIILFLSPLIAHLIGKLAFPSNIHSYTGLVILGILPTTLTTQILHSSIANGNTFLSSINSISSNLISIFSIPFFIWLFFSHSLNVNILPIFQKTILILLFPILISQFARQILKKIPHYKKITPKLFSTSLNISQIFILIIIFTSISSNYSHFLLQFTSLLTFIKLLLVTLSFHFVLLFASFSLSKLLRFSQSNSISVLFSSSQKTLSLGIIIILSFFPNAQQGIIMLILFNIFQIFLDHILANFIQHRDQFPRYP